MKKLLLTAVLGAAMSVPTIALAVTDGVIGKTSTGEMNIEMRVVEHPNVDIQITGLQDIDFGEVVRYDSNQGGNPDFPAPFYNNAICVYMASRSTYAIEFQSFGHDGTLTNPADGEFGQLTSAQGGVSLYHWTYVGPSGNRLTSAPSTGGYTPSKTPTCAPEDMAELSVAIANPPQVNGLYTATLVVTVTPE